MTSPIALLLPVPLFAHGEDHGRALQPEYIADAVFNIPAIGEMEQLAAVAEDDKVRRFDADLRHVVDLQASALVGGRLNARLRVGKDIVEHAGGDSRTGLRIDIIDQLKESVYTLTCRSGDKDD